MKSVLIIEKQNVDVVGNSYIIVDNFCFTNNKMAFLRIIENFKNVGFDIEKEDFEIGTCEVSLSQFNKKKFSYSRMLQLHAACRVNNLPVYFSVKPTERYERAYLNQIISELNMISKVK